MPTSTLLRNHRATVGANRTPTRCVPQLWMPNSTTRIAHVMPMTALLDSPALTCRPETADSTAGYAECGSRCQGEKDQWHVYPGLCGQLCSAHAACAALQVEETWFESPSKLRETNRRDRLSSAHTWCHSDMQLPAHLRWMVSAHRLPAPLQSSTVCSPAAPAGRLCWLTADAAGSRRGRSSAGVAGVQDGALVLEFAPGKQSGM